MARVKPSKPRSTVVEEPSGLRIVIPARRNPFMILFVSCWLLGWGVGEFLVPSELLKGTPLPVDLFLIGWLIAWTTAGAFALYIWLWTLAGKELLFLNGTLLTFKRDILGFGRKKEYEMTFMSNLRVAPPFNWLDFRAALHFWGLGGVIAFDYGAKTYHFGSGIDEAEARTLVQNMKQRFPIPD
jgi:hypothetical protein